MTDTMTLVWGGYSVQFNISDLATNSWNTDKWRYIITDPDNSVHPGRLTGSDIETAVSLAVADIRSRETRIEESAKRLALEVRANESETEGVPL